MLLLDTHAFVWLASDLRQLTPRGKAAIRAAAGGLFVSAITSMEIAMLVKRGRLELPLPAAEFIGRALRQHGISELPVDGALALAAVALPDLHNDPFDRLIVATALQHKLTILSRDQMIPRYPGVTVIW